MGKIKPHAHTKRNGDNMTTFTLIFMFLDITCGDKWHWRECKQEFRKFNPIILRTSISLRNLCCWLNRHFSNAVTFQRQNCPLLANQVCLLDCVCVIVEKVQQAVTVVGDHVFVPGIITSYAKKLQRRQNLCAVQISIRKEAWNTLNYESRCIKEHSVSWQKT
jgi:hypothetical protein